MPGEPNAETLIDQIDQRPEHGLALYRLSPVTGRKHQLRAHRFVAIEWHRAVHHEITDLHGAVAELQLRGGARHFHVHGRGQQPAAQDAVVAQLETLLDDVELDAVKIGMVASREVAEVIADVLRRRRPRWTCVPSTRTSTSAMTSRTCISLVLAIALAASASAASPSPSRATPTSTPPARPSGWRWCA